MKTILPIIAVILLVFASCKKNEDNTPSPEPSKSKKELLTAKTWVGTGLTIDPAYDFGSGTPITDIFATYSDCNKDNVFKFKVDGAYSFEEGLTKCNPTDPQVYQTGTWRFDAGETHFIMTKTGDTDQVTNLIELSADKMSFKYESEDGGKIYTITYTLKAQ